MFQVEERTLTALIEPNTPRIQTDAFHVPFGEVHRITEVVALNKTLPDVELALHINGVRQTGFCASTVYIGNNSKPMADAFAGCAIRNLDLAYFVITPTSTVTDSMSIRFRIKIAKSTFDLEPTIGQQSQALS